MTADTVTLTAADGHQLSAYMAKPAQAPRAGLVVMQEIFGVNTHIRSVADEFAADGFLAIAPAMFDRVKPGLELGYDDFTTARESMGKLDREQCVADMAAAAAHVASAGKVGVVGYCWGGSMADLAACHGLVSAGVSYYGRMTVEWLELTPQCPMIYHYGEKDALIPLQIVEQIKRKRDGATYIWGGADHGFNCRERPQYHKNSAQKAREITLEFFAEHLG